MFHKEILNDKQTELLPLISEFKREYYLVGGTAIALYIGHRRSIDFDLFKFSTLNRKKNLDKITSHGYKPIVSWNVTDQMNLIVNEVKLTFFQYPFQIKADNVFEGIIRIPDLLDLAAMKAYALGRRSKWKDYVDLFFLFRVYHPDTTIRRGNQRPPGFHFNEYQIIKSCIFPNENHQRHL